MSRPVLSPEEERQLRRLLGRANANLRWAMTDDRAAATAPGRAAFLRRFEDQVDPDRKLPPAERAERAAQARRAYFQKLAVQSAKARAARKRSEGGRGPYPDALSAPEESLGVQRGHGSGPAPTDGDGRPVPPAAKPARARRETAS